MLFVPLHPTNPNDTVNMKNPFKILWLMLKAKRPSRIGEMKATTENFWLGRSYYAMMFFGTMLVHTKEEADKMDATTSDMDSAKRHETIHLRQAQSTHDSWLCYYVLYIWYYVRALPQNRHFRNAAYYLNPFEMEAYEHMYDTDYLAKCTNGANGWRVYAKMKPSERRELSKS